MHCNHLFTWHSPGTWGPGQPGALLLFETLTTTNSGVLNGSQLQPGWCCQIKVSKAAQEIKLSLLITFPDWSCRFQVLNRIMSHTLLLGTTQHDFSWLNSHLHCWISDFFFFSKSSINRKPPKYDQVAKVFLPSFNIFLIT